MSRLIVKSPYIKSGGKSSGYMKYIATRSGVEILPAANGYMRYMATRPGTEKRGAHGLFGDADSVDLSAAMAELTAVHGNIWTHIISLRREDAARLGYDSADAWRNLLKTHRNDIAAAMKISPQDFHWYAAFHNEGDHPHVHMMAWSAKQNDGYLTQNGINKIRSKLTNTVFIDDMHHLYKQKTMSRDELIKQAREDIHALAERMKTEPVNPEIGELMFQLSDKLKTVQGKKQYGYLPKNVKHLVDEIVDKLAAQPAIREVYDTWWELQVQLRSFYSSEIPEQPPLSEQKEFRSIKNAVVSEALNLPTQNYVSNQPLSPPILISAAKLIADLGRMFEESVHQQAGQQHHTDRKLLRKLRAKKMAMGLNDFDIS